MFGRKRKLAKEKEEKERIENYQNAREKQTEIGQRFWKVVDLYPEVEKSCYFKNHLQNRYYNSWEVPVLDECGAAIQRDYNAACNLRDYFVRIINTAGTAGIHACGDVTSTLRLRAERVTSVKQEAPSFRWG